MNKYLNYTVKEAANAARVSLPTMYEWCKRTDFPALKVGRKILIPIAPFQRWLEVQAGEVPSDGQLV